MHLKIKAHTKIAEIQQVPNLYESPISSEILKDAKMWFEEVGLLGTKTEESFITNCRGPKNISNPNEGSILSDEIAIRLFILFLFSNPQKILSTPQTYEVPQSLSIEKGRADQVLTFVEEEISKAGWSKHHYSQPKNIKELKEEYDPKGFFDDLYNFLKEHIVKWSSDRMPQEAIDEVKQLRDQCFNKMSVELSDSENAEEYKKNIKENYLSELNDIIKYSEKTFKKEVKRQDISIDVQSKITWKQTKALMSDPKGDIRKYIALKKWQQAFILSPGRSPVNQEVAKSIGITKPLITSIYTNSNLFNYLYSNESTRKNQTYRADNIFKKTVFELKLPEINNLTGIMDWIAGNIRTDQIAQRYYQGRLLTEVDRGADGRFSDDVWRNSEEVNYTDGDILVYEDVPMGLAMFNMEKHNSGGAQRRFQHPTQFEIEKMVENYTISDMIQAQKKYHKFLESFRAQDLNYKELNPILIDYRTDTFGYYWADLNTNGSSEEAKRMGHCGRDGAADDLFSLRSIIKDESLKNISYRTMTRGTSWLTASITKNGNIRQLKTLKNARPKERDLLEKIIDLLTKELPSIKSKALPFQVTPLDKKLKMYNGKTVNLSEYAKPNLIQPYHKSNKNPGLDSSGYMPSNDFHLEDLPDDLLKQLYESRPDFFAWKSKSEETNKIDERLKNIYGFKEEEKPEINIQEN